MTALSGSQPALRRAFAFARIAAGLLVFGGIVTQIVDELVHNAFLPDQYFVYFTIQSSMMNVVVLLVGGVVALRSAEDTRLFSNVRVAILAYAVVTGLVYNALLRNLHSSGYQGIHWPTEVMHVAIPIFIVIDWIAAPGRQPIRWKALAFVAIYPLAWLAFTMVRGGITGWYPYPFLEPSQPGGVLAVVAYSVGIAIIILGFASIGIAISRRRTRAAASPEVARRPVQDP